MSDLLLQVAIPLVVAEGPDSFAAVKRAKDHILAKVAEHGLGEQDITWHWEKPVTVHGVPLSYYEPTMGVWLVEPYYLQATHP